MKKFLLLLASVLAFFTVSAATPAVIFSEDFTAFSEGSENEPAKTDISSGYTNKLSSTLTGWSGKYVYEAGGMLKIGDSGKLTTARYNMSANSGVVKISLRVRSYSEAGMMLKISLGYSISKQIFLYDNEWHNVEFITAGGSSISSISIEPSYTFDGMLIDKFEVTTSADFFPAPDPYQPSRADGKSFTASWKRVSGATSYLLDVYSKKDNGDKEYLLKDENVTTTSKSVTGLDETKKYFFTVRATNGTAISDYSDEIEVVKVISEIAAPKALNATNVTANRFTANWNAVQDANSYLVSVIKRSKITTAGEYEMVSDDFSGVKIGSLSDVEFATISGHLDSYTKVPGWSAENPAFAAGYIALAPFGSSAASITSPYIDLSSDNGSLKAIINMAEMNYGTDYEGGIVTVSLLDEDGKALESQDVAMTKGFKDYVINFTKGTGVSAVKVSYNGSKKIFIDSFAIKQNLAVGYTFNSFEQIIEAEGTSVDVNVSEPIVADKTSYAYSVAAVGRTVSSGDIVDITSDSSNIIEVMFSSSVEQNVAAKTAKLFRANGAITIETANACEVEVYSLSGAILSKTTVAEGVSTIDLPTNDVVIVKIDNKAVKL